MDLVRRLLSPARKNKARKEAKQVRSSDLVSRGGGSPVEDHHHPEVQGAFGSGRFPIGSGGYVSHCSSSASDESVFHAHQSSISRRTRPETGGMDVSIPGLFDAEYVTSQYGEGGATGRYKYGASGRYGGGVAMPGDVDPAAIERARRDLQGLVNIRTDSEHADDTSMPDASESEAEDMGRTGLTGNFSFDGQPGVQHVQLLRDKVTGALGFALKFPFVQEEGIYLACVGSVDRTAQFVPLTTTLKTGDVLLTANGQLIAGRQKEHVMHILQGMTNRLVELTIIRSRNNIFSDDARSELHQLCHHIRIRLQEAPSRPNQVLDKSLNAERLQEQHPLARAQSEESPSLPSTYPDTSLSVNGDVASGGDDDDDDDDGEYDGPGPEAPPPVTGQDTNEATTQQSKSAPQQPPASHSESDDAILPTDEEFSRLDYISLPSLRMEHLIEFGRRLDPYFDQWRIIADRGGLSRQDILVIETRRSRVDGRFTEAVLEELAQRRSMSVGELCRIILEFKRMDIMQYVKEKIVPDLPCLEQREKEGRQGRPRRPQSPDSSLISGLETTDATSCTDSLSTAGDYGQPLSYQPDVVQQRSTPHGLVFPVQCAPLQAPMAAGRPPRSQSRTQRKDGTCQICSSKHTEYVYISYAQDMKKYVEQVVTWLRRCGMAVHYDQMDKNGREAKPALQWKIEQLEGAEFVLVLCSPGYIQQLNDDTADNRVSPCCQPGCGVSSDINYIAQDIYRRNGNYRCIPVLVNGFRYDCIPTFLRNTHVYRFPDQEESIFRRLTKTKEFELPPLGPRRILKPRKEW